MEAGNHEHGPKTMIQDIGRHIGNTIANLFILCCIFVPLGIWKLVDIVIWLWDHVSIAIK